MEEQEIINTGEGFTNWPEIVGLHIVRNNWLKGGREYWKVKPEIIYKGKIKLHGNNGGVSIKEDADGSFVVQAQSRNRVLSVTDDLGGFAKWATQHQEAFIHVRRELKKAFPDTKQTMVFGEWCGMGIQSNVALCGIKKKIFAVFSIMIDGGIIFDPTLIASFFPATLPENLHIIPWMISEECGEQIVLNYDDVAQLESQLPQINTLVRRIDTLDPWVREIFQVDGPGEGVVWYPVSLVQDKWLTNEDFSRLAFKTKGEKHAVVKQAKPAQIKPEVSAGVPEFVDMFVTQGRGEQGIGKVCGDGKPTKAHTGQFCKWMTDDVKKESATELEASNLTWKQVEKEVGAAARKWFLEFVDKQQQ